MTEGVAMIIILSSGECALGANHNGWRDMCVGTDTLLPVTVLLHRCDLVSCLSLVPVGAAAGSQGRVYGQGRAGHL